MIRKTSKKREKGRSPFFSGKIMMSRCKLCLKKTGENAGYSCKKKKKSCPLYHSKAISSH